LTCTLLLLLMIFCTVFVFSFMFVLTSRCNFVQSQRNLRNRQLPLAASRSQPQCVFTSKSKRTFGSHLSNSRDTWKSLRDRVQAKGNKCVHERTQGTSRNARRDQSELVRAETQQLSGTVRLLRANVDVTVSCVP
jgi:hypothetical protein